MTTLINKNQNDTSKVTTVIKKRTKKDITVLDQAISLTIQLHREALIELGKH
jgi:hypothetical protein